MLDRIPGDQPQSEDEVPEDAHISGQELLIGIREFATQQFGYLARTVFNQWGLKETEDFGRIVFELVERGDMRKTDNDRMEDFVDVYDFGEVFESDYRIDTSSAFSRN